jgi:hypothetical protein
MDRRQKYITGFAVLCFVLCGCYEDVSEVVLNADGSGSVKEKLVFSERFITATLEGDGGKSNMPPSSKEDMLKEIGSTVDITSFTSTEQPDGGRVIEFEGTFSSAEQFFLSEFCSETLKLRLAPVEEGKAAIYCEAGQSDGDISGPNITQMYGLAKGLYIKRTIHLPGEIEKSNGDIGKDKKTVSWVTDLRDKEGLARTKAFAEGKTNGVGSAVFDASALKFSLPLKAAKPEEAAKTEKESSSQESSGLKAEVAWVAINKKAVLDGKSDKPAISDLELGIKVSWNKDGRPVACQEPVLTSIQDDAGNDLVRSSYDNVHKISESDTEKELKIKTREPDGDTKKIRNVEGYVPVVTNLNKEKVVLLNMQELAGEEVMGDPVLDKLGFKIISIKGFSLNIQIEDGHNAITSLEVFRKDGSKVKRRGGGGWGNNYTYDFNEDISKLNKCELEIVVSQTVVKVPFSLKEAALP